MKDWLRYVKDGSEKRLNAMTPDDELMDYVCVEVSHCWPGDVQGLVGRICVDKEVESLNDETVFVFDKKNPAGSTISITSLAFPDGFRVLIVVQVWLDRTYNPIAKSWPIMDGDRSLGEPKIIDLTEIDFLKN